MCLYRKMKINLRMSEKNSTFAGLFCANVRVCACEYSNGKVKNGLYILLGMLLLVLPMTAQDTIPMPSQEGAWLHDESVAPAVSPVMAEMLDIEEKPKEKQVIDARVVYSSSDSLMMTGKGIAHMFGSGEVKYKALELTADYIRVCMDSSTLYASGVLDTNTLKGLTTDVVKSEEIC